MRNLRANIVNELDNLLRTGKNRTEFYIMSFYSAFLLLLTILAIKNGQIKTGDPASVFCLFTGLGAYFLIDDYVKRNDKIQRKKLFLLDSIVYTSLIIALIHYTGGYHSPIRLPLLFLTVISVPIFGTIAETALFMVAIGLIQIMLFLNIHPLTAEIYITILESLTLFAATMLLKTTVDLYRKKADDYRDLNKEQEELYNLIIRQNEELEKIVRQKTTEIKAALDKTKNDKLNLEKQQAAMLNILEDMSETQKDLEDSKMAIEKKNNDMEALSRLTRDLAEAETAEEIFASIINHLGRFISYDSITFCLINLEKEDETIYKTVIRQKSGKNIIQTAKNRIYNFLHTINVINQPYEQWAAKSHAVIIGENLLEEDTDNQAAAFDIVLPISIGASIGGAAHISSSTENLYENNKEVIEAIFSAASVSISGLQKIMKSQQSKTASLIRSLSNGVVMIDRNMEIVLSNPAAEKFLNLGKTVHNFQEFLDLYAESGIKSFLEKSMITGQSEKISEIKLDQNFFEIHINPVKNQDGNIMATAVIFHDITEIKLIDQMKTEFVSVASHQLRTPLTAIKLFSEMLMSGEAGPLEETQKGYLSNIFHSTERMSRLVNDLLNVARIESGRLNIVPEPVGLANLINNIIAETKPLAEIKGCGIVFEQSTEASNPIPLDQNLIRQVFHNLITNAIKYTNAGIGLVTIKLEEYNKQAYVIKIKDNGIGIPAEAQSRIFDKFFRADNAIKKETEGSGLGLYVSKMIIEASGGKIWFESKDGQGTSFSVVIPKKGMKEKLGGKDLAAS